ncbi:hypothetical protein AHiyo8_19870 [Arthrobacter sp. Hiyo8]|nr:hypothetical protein AHiyo8_19870 [Arthrobacter sp. Hiyo8]
MRISNVEAPVITAAVAFSRSRRITIRRHAQKIDTAMMQPKTAPTIAPPRPESIANPGRRAAQEKNH